MGPVRVGVLGGTFDPPHLAHLTLAAAARRALALDRVLFVVAGEPWRKAEREVSPASARVRMTEAAVALLPWAEVSRIEVERAGPTYSSETLAALVAAQPLSEPAEWWFILGTDALADLPHWHQPEHLLALARLALVERRGGEADGAALPAATVAAFPGIESRIDRVPAPLLDISSTGLRARVRAGETTRHLLPEPVRAVIDELGLYR